MFAFVKRLFRRFRKLPPEPVTNEALEFLASLYGKPVAAHHRKLIEELMKREKPLIPFVKPIPVDKLYTTGKLPANHFMAKKRRGVDNDTYDGVPAERLLDGSRPSFIIVDDVGSAATAAEVCRKYSEIYGDKSAVIYPTATEDGALVFNLPPSGGGGGGPASAMPAIGSSGGEFSGGGASADWDPPDVGAAPSDGGTNNSGSDS